MSAQSKKFTHKIRRLILASASPRRAALLREAGYPFEVIAPPLEEPDNIPEHLSPQQRAEALSYFKGRSVADNLRNSNDIQSGPLILAADTMAALGDRVFGKPEDRDDARRILQALQGTTHRVITGVTLLDVANNSRIIEHDSTNVTMRPIADEELEDYLDTQAWVGKAGAYGIQDHGDAFCTNVEGSFSNVVGLPMELVSRMLNRAVGD